MGTMQLRLNSEMITQLELLIKQGKYSNRGEAVRGAVRRFIWRDQVGKIKNNGINSVEEIRELRRKLSGKEIDLEKINHLERKS